MSMVGSGGYGIHQERDALQEIEQLEMSPSQLVFEYSSVKRDADDVVSCTSSNTLNTLEIFARDEIIPREHLITVQELLENIPLLSDLGMRSPVHRLLLRLVSGFQNWEEVIRPDDPKYSLPNDRKKYPFVELLRYIRNLKHKGERSSDLPFLQSLAHMMSSMSPNEYGVADLKSKARGVQAVVVARMMLAFPKFADTVKTLKREASHWVDNKKKVVRELRKGIPPCARKSSNDLMHLALCSENVDAVKILLDWQIDMDASDAEGVTIWERAQKILFPFSKSIDGGLDISPPYLNA
jgi:hypothetical protein